MSNTGIRYINHMLISEAAKRLTEGFSEEMKSKSKVELKNTRYFILLNK